MQQTKIDVPPLELTRQLDAVEDEVSGLAAVKLTRRDAGAHLVELAAREYEILEALSRPWRRLELEAQRLGDRD